MIGKGRWEFFLMNQFGVISLEFGVQNVKRETRDGKYGKGGKAGSRTDGRGMRTAILNFEYLVLSGKCYKEFAYHIKGAKKSVQIAGRYRKGFVL